MKTLAIRLDDDLHAQLSVIAQLAGHSLTDEIRQAIEAHTARMRTNPELSAKAEALLADIQRDAQARQQAIADLFTAATDKPSPTAARAAKKATRGSTRRQSSNG